MLYTGSCRCGAVRFEVDAAPLWRGYCHCGDCRASTASPVSAYVTFSRDAMRWAGETPRVWRSSEHVERAFCATCGSPIYFDDDREPEQIDMFTVLFDDSAALAPEEHIWYGSKLSWFDVDDDLPRHV